MYPICTVQAKTCEFTDIMPLDMYDSMAGCKHVTLSKLGMNRGMMKRFPVAKSDINFKEDSLQNIFPRSIPGWNTKIEL